MAKDPKLRPCWDVPRLVNALGGVEQFAHTMRAHGWPVPLSTVRAWLRRKSMPAVWLGRTFAIMELNPGGFLVAESEAPTDAELEKIFG